MAKKKLKNGLLFVYGTLMKGFHERWQLDLGASLIGPGSIKAKLYDFGEFPGATLARRVGQDRVKGELYGLSDPDAALRKLDEYEEYFPAEPRRSLFVRRKVPVVLADGSRETAWAYFYNRPVDEARPIPSGNYREKATARV